MFERESRIVKDGSKLDFDYVPARLVCREAQMRDLETDFRPMAMDGRPCSAFVTGGVGTGKTVTVKRFVADMTEHMASHGGMDSVYVNCRTRSSEYAVILTLVRHFDPGYPDRGFSAEEMMQSLGRHVASAGVPFVIVLDEADALLKGNGRDIIYQLSRFSELASGRASISVILISQSSVAPLLDPASMSSFRRANAVRFPLYTEGELFQIVRSRADEALYPDTLTDDCARLIASVAKGGDARFAIEVLEKAADIAEGEEAGYVTPDDVRSAGAMIYSTVSESKLEELDLQRMIALLAISRAMKDKSSVMMGAAEKTYAVVCEEYGQPARKHTQFYTYVQDIERLGLISTKVVRDPDGGRATSIAIDGIPPRELADRLEYLIDAMGLVRRLRCDKCGREAVTFVRYSGRHLCAEHFVDLFERRVKKEIPKQVSLERGDVVGVAVSGGKDSMVMLSILSSIFNEKNGIELHCISIDEGIEGYRPPSLDIVRSFCRERGVPYHERSFRELGGLTMDAVAPVSGDSSPCTYCGVFRRKLMNDEARRIGARYLATGHNLDDMCQTVMMNFVRGDLERMARLGPHDRVRPGLVPRFYPLRTVPEKESLLYSILKPVPHWDGECPYWKEALRNEYRDVVDGLEDRSPGSKYSILSSYDKMRPMLAEAFPPSDVRFCACGEPCNGARCKACEYEETLRRRLGSP